MLSQAFNQPEVFPLGHEMVAETMGIWLWIVPEKYRVSKKPTSELALPLCQNESSCKTFHMEMPSVYMFIFMQINMKVVFNRGTAAKLENGHLNVSSWILYKPCKQWESGHGQVVPEY